MATLRDILGGGSLEGLLTPEQQAAAEGRARSAGLLNLGFALLQASQGQRGQGKPSLAQVIGQAGPVGVQAYQQSFDRTLQDALRSMQIQEMRKKQQEQDRMREAIRGAYTTRPVAGLGIGQEQLQYMQPEIEAFGAEGIAPAAATVAPTERVVDRSKLLSAIAEFAPEKYLELTQPKEGKETYRPMTDQEKKAYKLPADRAYQISSTGKIDEVGKGPLVQVLGEGQKGLDNEMKIRSAFSGEPVYKAFQEMRSAYGQITDSLRQASPAGDLAAATKFMKLLDPGSVVRESELYMAMQASGALDRLVNYAEMRIKGTKLTPEQRIDFQNLANQLFSTAAGSFNQKRSEYADLATNYGLNPDRAVGAAAVIPTPSQARTNSLVDQARAELARRQGQR